MRFLEELAARYGLRVSHVTDTLKWWTVHLSALDGGAGSRLPSTRATPVSGRASAPGGSTRVRSPPTWLPAGKATCTTRRPGRADPYTRIGPARYDYHKALLAYQALRETKAGRSLMEIQDTDKPRPDAIALDAAYRAVRRRVEEGVRRRPGRGGRREVRRLGANGPRPGEEPRRARHRAGIFRAALDVFTESAGHLASRTRATAEDPAAWARVSEGLPRSTQAAGPTAGEKTTATGDTPQTEVPGPASQPETPRPSSQPVAAQDTFGAAPPPPASPQQPANDSPGAQARETASPRPGAGPRERRPRRRPASDAVRRCGAAVRRPWRGHIGASRRNPHADTRRPDRPFSGLDVRQPVRGVREAARR